MAESDRYAASIPYEGIDCTPEEAGEAVKAARAVVRAAVRAAEQYSGLNPDQYAQLLKPINPNRVGKDRNGRAHVEAYEIRAHLIRLFGPANWSQRVLDMQMIFETATKDGETEKVTVAYRAQVELTVNNPDGTPRCTYVEWATGDAINFPIRNRGDAHDFAMKTAESQGLKRCAMNLGDQFGLSLYRQGSVQGLVGRSLVQPAGVTKPAEQPAVDGHITEALPAESDEVPEQRTTNKRRAPEPAKAAADTGADVESFRKLALNPPKNADQMWWARLQTQAIKHLKAPTTDAAGNTVTLAALLQSCMKAHNERTRGTA